MTVTAPIDLSPVDDFDPDIELADFLAGGRPYRRVPMAPCSTFQASACHGESAASPQS
jgi:hypothetical protein